MSKTNENAMHGISPRICAKKKKNNVYIKNQIKYYISLSGIRISMYEMDFAFYLHKMTQNEYMARTYELERSFVSLYSHLQRECLDHIQFLHPSSNYLVSQLSTLDFGAKKNLPIQDMCSKGNGDDSVR